MWLTVRTGDDRGRTVHVADGRFVIGRDEACDLVLRDAKVSRRHAALERLPDGDLVLRDLGSANGTLVNGSPVQEAVVLRGNEQLQLGDTVLVSSQQEPTAERGSTVVGSSRSALHRLVLERSVRRATILGVASLVAAAGAAALAFGLTRADDVSTDVERVVRGAAPSTVFVEALRDGARVESGSGWVLDARAGLIVTNAHVVNGGSTFRAGVPGGLRPARVVAVAPCEDLAVLAVRPTRGLRSLPLGSQSSVELGETVVAVGYPANASAEASLTSTTGVVSVVRTVFREPAPDVPRYPNVIQTDAAINPGSSGGPLLDLEGRLIGVNSAGRTLAPDGRIIQGQGYAIGVDRVEEITRILRTGHSLAWTGLGFEYPGKGSLLASSAVPGTAAAEAGVRRGARLLAVNGMPLDNSLASYCDAVAGMASGDRVALTVRNPGAAKPREIAVELE